MKLEPVVKNENLYMLLGCAACTVVVQLVFWAVNLYDITVLWGGLWGLLVTHLNFFIMTVAIQRAVASGDEQQAKMKLQASYTGRMLLLVSLMFVGIVVPFMHWAPVLVSVFFPHVVIAVRGLVSSIRNRGKEEPTFAPVSYDEEDEEKEDGVERLMGHFSAKASSGIISIAQGEDKNKANPGEADETSSDSL